ncbi:hypothetical protein BC670_2395 [Flavobacterium branchiophilum]|uniref:Uncharacterized protein n=2 Tax=Flavobacterium branchiophilum TaxID=55197 RepID=A0A543G5U1_9FLAO|nr:hypothetical protein BC670_2395 [Flavobacterium branchiophilum]
MVDGWWLVVDGWWLMVGGWWLMVDGWWLVVDGWWLMVGGWWLVVVCVRDSSENPFLALFLGQKRLKRIARPEVLRRGTPKRCCM